jgi:hypothetical protein
MAVSCLHRNAQLRARARKGNLSEQPKSKLWLFLNSGIFLGSLSAGLLTVGGGYVTNHQQCMRDADKREHQD